jgi:hypothetical protein
MEMMEITKRTALARNTIRAWVRKPAAKAAESQYVRQRKLGKLTPYHVPLVYWAGFYLSLLR